MNRLDYVNYRHVCHKWHFRLTKVKTLKSNVFAFRFRVRVWTFGDWYPSLLLLNSQIWWGSYKSITNVRSMINSLPPPPILTLIGVCGCQWVFSHLFFLIFLYIVRILHRKKKTDFKKLIEIAQCISRHYSSCLIIQNCPPFF